MDVGGNLDTLMLASALADALGQIRVYVSYAGEDLIFQRPEAQTPTGGLRRVVGCAGELSQDIMKGTGRRSRQPRFL